MNKQRLLRLCERLDKVNPDHFDIGTWYRKGSQQVKKLSSDGKILDEGFCGSNACVLGTAALIKDFNKEGLYIRLIGGYDGHVVYDKDGVYKTDAEAGALFFDIPEQDARFLFYTPDEIDFDFACLCANNVRSFYDPSRRIIAPEMVAKRLREYVETDGKVLYDYVEELR